LECFVVAALFTCVLVFVIIVLTQSNARVRGWNRSYSALAQKYGGQWMSASAFGKPSARFQYGSTFCFLNNTKTNAKGGGPFTQLAINWDDPKFRLEVFPSWRSNKLWPFTGMQPFEVRDSRFAKQYVVRTNNPEVASVLMSDGVCWQIDRLRSYLDADDIYVALSRGVLTIKKPSFIKEYQELDDFVRFGLELYDQAMLTRTVGIEFVNQGETQVLSEVICQICGDQINVDMVFCVRCQTPHCLECWQYYGQCSTYACGETRFFAPKIASGSSQDSNGSI